ncbi:MAG: hypothetical protein MZW92_26880 [Comamonadaceae bacterium]|nr:hypothetical protein [Comamonadaceae bacterium]
MLAMKPRHRPEQDPRHHPHLPDAGRGQQVRRRRLEEGACAAEAAGLGGTLPRLAARLGPTRAGVAPPPTTPKPWPEKSPPSDPQPSSNRPLPTLA